MKSNMLKKLLVVVLLLTLVVGVLAACGKKDPPTPPEPDTPKECTKHVVGKNGKALAVLTYYSEDDDAGNRTVRIDFEKQGKYEVCLLDAGNDGVLTTTTEEPFLGMKVHSCLLIKEV